MKKKGFNEKPRAAKMPINTLCGNGTSFVGVSRKYIKKKYGIVNIVVRCSRCPKSANGKIKNVKAAKASSSTGYGASSGGKICFIRLLHKLSEINDRMNTQILSDENIETDKTFIKPKTGAYR